MGNYKAWDNWHAIRKETAFRCGCGGSQTTPTSPNDTGYAVISIDDTDETFDFPEPWLKEEATRPLGDGRNESKVTALGYEATDKTYNAKLMLATFLYYALGGCTTTGTSAPIADETVTASAGASTITTASSYTLAANALKGIPVLIGSDVRYIVSHPACSAAVVTLTLNAALVVTGSQTMKWLGGASNVATSSANSNNTITYSTASNITVTANALKGMVLVHDYGGTPVRYTILAHDAVTASNSITFTVDRTVAAHGTKTFKLETFPFTHTIIEANTLPSFVWHIEKENSGQEIRRDVFGCTVKTLELTVEKGAVVKMTVTVMGPAVGAGNHISTLKPDLLTEEYYTFPMVDRGQFSMSCMTSINAAGYVEGSAATLLNESPKFTITIENDVTMEPVQGDEYAYKRKIGTRTYTIKHSITPTTDDLRTLKNTKMKDISTATALVLPLNREYPGTAWASAIDYIQLTFSSLRVSAYPEKVDVMGSNQAEEEVEVEYKNGGRNSYISAGTLAIAAKDKRSALWYENH